MKLLFNFKKKTVFMQVDKDCYISMQSCKRIIVPRQNLVKLKETGKQNVHKRILNVKELTILNAYVSNLYNFSSEIINEEVIIHFEIDGHSFKLIERDNDIEFRGYVPVYCLISLLSYILK